MILLVRPGRDRHRERRRDLELLVQPADRAVLPRERPTTRSRTACAAASRRAARPASRAAATTGRSRSATGTRSASRSTATSRPTRSTPTSSTAARSRATTGAPARSRTSRRGPLRGARLPRAAHAAGPLLAASTRTSSTSPRTRCGRRRDGGQHWEAISPDLTRASWDVPANVGMYRAATGGRSRRSAASIYTLAPSPLDAER